MLQRRNSRSRQERRGVSAIIVVQLFAVMLVFAFFAINVANIQRQHTASQVASDLASRWGVDLLSRTNNKNVIERQVRELAQRNWTVTQNTNKDWLQNNRKNIIVEVEIGSATFDGTDFEFAEGQRPYNAVRVDSSSHTDIVGFLAPRGPEQSVLRVQRSATSVALERDICLVIDRSGSMTFDLTTGTWMNDNSIHPYNAMASRGWGDIYKSRASWWHYWAHPTNSRWSTMIPAMYGLADELDTTNQKELFSIVSYSTEYSRTIYGHDLAITTYNVDAAEIEYQPSNKYRQAVSAFDNKFKWNSPVMGGTNISAGIDEAADVLTGPGARPNAYKTMIVMTDGQYNEGRDPAIAASDAVALGIEVYTVTFSKQADQKSMKFTADAGNGRHFHAPDGDALDEVFRRIANLPPSAFIE